jgi:hypothetical protein
MAVQPVVVNNQKLRTASELTQERRQLASGTFFADGGAVGTIRGNGHAPVSTKKTTGRPPDASAFTAFVGSHAMQNDVEVFPPAGKTTARSCGTGGCLPATPVPYITSGPNATTGVAPANRVPRSGSDYIRERLACQQAQGEQHIASELGRNIFIDNTITNPELNKQTLANTYSVGPGHTLVAGGVGLTCSPAQAYGAANHTHQVTDPRLAPCLKNGALARPAKSQIPNYSKQFESQDHVPPIVSTLPNCFTGKNTTSVFSQGSVIASKHPRYVERKHGNVVPSRNPYPVRYNIPYGSPAHMKINDPIGPRTPGM